MVDIIEMKSGALDSRWNNIDALSRAARYMASHGYAAPAEVACRLALDLLGTAVDDVYSEDADAALCVRELADAYYRVGRLDEAEFLANAALSVFQRAAGPQSSLTRSAETLLRGIREAKGGESAR